MMFLTAVDIFVRGFFVIYTVILVPDIFSQIYKEIKYFFDQVTKPDESYTKRSKIFQLILAIAHAFLCYPNFVETWSSYLQSEMESLEAKCTQTRVLELGIHICLITLIINSTYFYFESEYLLGEETVNHTRKLKIFPLFLMDDIFVNVISETLPWFVNKFKKAHNNALSKKMVHDKSVKMKSVGASKSRNSAIKTGARSRRINKRKARKRITSLPRSLDRVSDIRPGNANKFKKAHDNTLSEQMVDNMSVKMKSVGAIVSKSLVEGTCFRVGSKYVMTAFHVVENIINPRKLPSIADNDWSKLDDLTVYIRFTASVLDILRPIFYIKPDVIYMNKQLDIAVLELKILEGLPRSLKLSKNFGHVKCVNIIGFGHPTDPRKQLDANCEVLNINYRHVITAFDNYVKANPSILQLNEFEPGGLIDAYIELKNENKFPCHTFLEHGSSGAPAIEENEVVGILIEGIPGAYYRLRNNPHLTDSGIDKLPKNLMFELCIKTESIFNDMSSIVPMLAADLFD